MKVCILDCQAAKILRNVALFGSRLKASIKYAKHMP